jgi:hypothetical protein
VEATVGKMNNVTVAANSGSGIVVFGALTLSNSLVATNEPTDCVGELAADRFSLVADVGADCVVQRSSSPTTAGDVEPRLGRLGDHGGDTDTIEILPGSPAIDGGPSAADNALVTVTPCEPTDQRGMPGPQGRWTEHDDDLRCDLGAYERRPACPCKSFVAGEIPKVSQAKWKRCVRKAVETRHPGRAGRKTRRTTLRRVFADDRNTRCFDRRPAEDPDRDGILSAEDNCPTRHNPNQRDTWTATVEATGATGTGTETASRTTTTTASGWPTTRPTRTVTAWAMPATPARARATVPT